MPHKNSLKAVHDGEPRSLDHVKLVYASPGSRIAPAEGAIDPKIVNLVKAVNLLGIDTNSSCEGHSGWGRTKYPYVATAYGGIFTAEQFTYLAHVVGEFNKGRNVEEPAVLNGKYLYIMNTNNRKDILPKLQGSAERLAGHLFTDWKRYLRKLPIVSIRPPKSVPMTHVTERELDLVSSSKVDLF